jgi:hypothetical protein
MALLAGNSKHPVNTKIRIKGIKGEDSDLNGLTGTLTHPFEFGFKSKNVGVFLDKKGVVGGDIVNLSNSEYEVILDDESKTLLDDVKELLEEVKKRRTDRDGLVELYKKGDRFEDAIKCKSEVGMLEKFWDKLDGIIRKHS